MVKLICGLPGSGKTTYVKKHIKPGDMVYDFDALCKAVTYSDPHDAIINSAVKQIINSMIYSFCNNTGLYGISDVYIIRTAPNKKEWDKIKDSVDEIIYIQAPIDLCIKRLSQRKNKETLKDLKSICRRLNLFLQSNPPTIQL